MITRKPTFKDWAKLGELIGVETAAQWMMNSNKSKDYVTLITLEKKKIIACLLGVYKNNILQITNYSYPENKENIGRFILNRAINYLESLQKKVSYTQFISNFTDSETLKKLNFKPKETIYYLDLNEDQDIEVL